MRGQRDYPAIRTINLITSSLLLLIAHTLVAEETPPPCELPEAADEHMEYQVSYMGISIGTVDLYYTDEGDGCGLLIMETFPGIGFLRAYTEYFGLLGEDGYIREGHFWQDEDDYWDYRRLERDPESNNIVRTTYTADSKFGALGEREDINRSSYDSPGHNAISLIPAIRHDVAEPGGSGVRETEYPFYFDGRRKHLPVLYHEGRETISVEAFDSEHEVVNTEIDLDFEGVYGLRDALKVQFTADRLAIPVYAEARIVIGRIRLELTGYGRP